MGKRKRRARVVGGGVRYRGLCSFGPCEKLEWGKHSLIVISRRGTMEISFGGT